MVLKQGSLTLIVAAGAATIGLCVVQSCGDAGGARDAPPDGDAPSESAEAALVDSSDERNETPFPMPGSDPVPGFTSGWTRVPWASQCALFQPGDGSGTSVPVPKWTPCASGRPGCRQLVTDWASPKYASASRLSGTRSPSGSVRLSFVRQYSPYQREFVVWDEDAGIVAAWRHDGDPRCVEVVPGDINAGAMVMTEAIRTDVTHVSQYVQVVGAPSDLLSKRKADYVFSSADIGFIPEAFMSQSTASSAIVTMEFGELNAIAVRNRQSGTAAPLLSSGRMAYVHTGQSATGDKLFFSSLEDVEVWSPSGLHGLISRQPTIAHDAATDGSGLVWIESSSPDTQAHFQNSVLFWSPFATDASGIVPRRLATGLCHTTYCGTKLSGGYAVVALDSGADAVVRVVDGARWNIQPTVEASFRERWTEAGFALNDEVWVTWTDGRAEGIQRISVAALGAPDHD